MEGLKMHRTAYRALRDNVVRERTTEAALLIAHLAIFLGCAFTVLSPLRAVVFVLVQQAVLGVYFGMLFAPNHKGMPVRRDGETLDWLERQVLTSRNIAPSPLIDFLYGGLNYQVEHHLFPSMPQMNLPAAGRSPRPTAWRSRFLTTRWVSFSRTAKWPDSCPTADDPAGTDFADRPAGATREAA